MYAKLEPWHTEWSQLNDPQTWDFKPPENRFNDCGPESIAAALKYLTGLELPADAVKDQILGEDKIGYTYWGQLRDWLNQNEFATTCYVGDGDPRSVVEEALGNGWPCLCLTYWRMSGAGWQATGHWRPVVEVHDDGVVLHETYGGGEKPFSWNEFYTWSTRFFITIRRVRPPDVGAGV